MSTNKIYMAVTADQYEFPVLLADSLKELSICYGMSTRNMNSYIHRKMVRKKEGVKFVRVEI